MEKLNDDTMSESTQQSLGESMGKIQLNEQQNSNNNHQSFTYYYSSFGLFDELNQFTFVKYTKFVKKLHAYLGGDWQMYANGSIYQVIEDVKHYLGHEDVFEVALQSWLEIRDIVNRQRKASYEDSKDEDEIEYFEESDIYDRFLAYFQNNLKDYQIDLVIFNPVAQGFFMSAVEIWNETIKSIRSQRVLSENNLVELGLQKERELEQESSKSKRQSQEEQQQQSYFGKIYKHVQSYQNNQIIKPLIVASETIMGYLGSNKKVKEEESKNQKKDAQSPSELSQTSQKNFCQFRDNLIQEEEVVLSKIKEMSLQEKSLNRKRRNRELDEQNVEEEDQMDQSETKKNVVSVDNFPSKAEKLNEQVYNYASQYIKSIKKNTQEKWQVARGFVTNIIELNNNILSKTQKISTEYTSSIKIRFLQPAQQFYNHLMEIWILFRHNTQKPDDFKKYLEKVKQSMGNKWSENYVLPTQFFFKTLVYTWEKLLIEERNNNTDEETLIKLFIERVRENMLKNWEKDIVNKIKTMKKKQYSTSNHQIESNQVVNEEASQLEQSGQSQSQPSEMSYSGGFGDINNDENNIKKDFIQEEEQQQQQQQNDIAIKKEEDDQQQQQQDISVKVEENM